MSDEQGEMRPAVQAASKARQRVLDAAELTQSTRRPVAEPRELAMPMVTALNYLVDAVLDLQGQVVALERLALANAAATQGTSKALLEHADGNQKVNEAMLKALETLAGAKP